MRVVLDLVLRENRIDLLNDLFHDRVEVLLHKIGFAHSVLLQLHHIKLGVPQMQRDQILQGYCTRYQDLVYDP
jgi:hypothetical protein